MTRRIKGLMEWQRRALDKITLNTTSSQNTTGAGHSRQGVCKEDPRMSCAYASEEEKWLNI